MSSEPYYDKIILLFKELVDVDGIKIPEIMAIVENGENHANITKDWLHSIYREIPNDPGIKKMDALYRILRKKKQKLQRAAANG